MFKIQCLDIIIHCCLSYKVKNDFIEITYQVEYDTKSFPKQTIMLFFYSLKMTN